MGACEKADKILKDYDESLDCSDLSIKYNVPLILVSYWLNRLLKNPTS